MAKVDRNRTYNPSTQEVTKAIEEVLEVNPNADWKEVHSELSEKNQSWKIPERRIAKFVKRSKGNSTEPGNDDDASVASSSSVGSIRKYFRERSSRKAAKKAASQSALPVDGDVDDDASVGSVGSLRRLFSRDKTGEKSQSKKMKSKKPPKANSAKGLPPRAPSGATAMSGSKILVSTAQEQEKRDVEQAQKPAPDDDEMSVSSRSSVRKFFKGRKARKAARKASKAAASSSSSVSQEGLEIETKHIEEAKQPNSSARNGDSSEILTPRTETSKEEEEEPEQFGAAKVEEKTEPIQIIATPTTRKSKSATTRDGRNVVSSVSKHVDKSQEEKNDEEKKEEDLGFTPGPADVTEITMDSAIRSSRKQESDINNIGSDPEFTDIVGRLHPSSPVPKDSGVLDTMIYSDDNDKKKEDARLCEGCLIL